MKISQFTVRILGIWLISLAGALILKQSGVFVATVIATFILAVLEGLKKGYYKNFD